MPLVFEVVFSTSVIARIESIGGGRGVGWEGGGVGGGWGGRGVGWAVGAGGEL